MYAGLRDKVWIGRANRLRIDDGSTTNTASPPPFAAECRTGAALRASQQRALHCTARVSACLPISQESRFYLCPRRVCLHTRSLSPCLLVQTSAVSSQDRVQFEGQFDSKS